MISVEKALANVLQQQRDYGTATVELMQSVGRILAVDVKADRDYPAFDRVMMDGIAIHTDAIAAGITNFTIQAIQAAGNTPLALGDNRQCIEVMTGAVLPANANAVVPYEEITISNGVAGIKDVIPKPHQNIHIQGSDCRQHDVLLKANTKIAAAHIGILASVGMYKVPVKALPHIAICSTGNELVEVDEQPLPYQIRKSNSYMLAAALQQEGITAAQYHFADDEAIMTEGLKNIISNNDVVLLSGAVSKGKYDYLPGILASLGMRTIFHRIAQRPGKPMLFGECDNGTLVFGFPGNPMSTFVCYQLYFKRWLYKSLGYKPAAITGVLSKQISFAPSLSWHVPVVLQNDNGIVRAVPVPGNNSGDIPSLANIEGLVTFPAEKTVFEEGLLVNIIPCQ